MEDSHGEPPQIFTLPPLTVMKTSAAGSREGQLGHMAEAEVSSGWSSWAACLQS